MKNTGYKGIDVFRIIAAVLVITIHTSPLETYFPLGDFILTRVIARTAVPFFFMTSGFFLLSEGCADLKRLKKFIKKTLWIYFAAVLLYLPANIYNGYFSGGDLFFNILKDIIFDGTFYHLWYLPASALGGAAAFFAVRRAGYKGALAVFLLLYAVGLFGDSYYGFITGIEPVKAVYGFIFTVSDHTRNGIFFAPLFMLMGGIASERERRSSEGKKAGAEAVCAVLFFALTLAEALILRKLGVQRHDSMYVFLVPLMRFLFGSLLRFKGKRKRYMSDLALIVYIIHPVTIIAVRGEAKALGLERLFIDNGIAHFAAVCVCSFAEGIGLLLAREALRKPKGEHLKKRTR
ncbi:MAG: acyltransferase [Bacteroides sp.]|nr:acyltransferase [Bacteroides sp.]